ncbi:MAG: methyltransferase domain-containing protein [Chryseobacterium jejuense]|uniref:methyltransferase domain-containing protein n=1 Tax=Chryseobacterium jejuense TaxID=445960 RepID=UPI003D12FA67
MNFICVNCKSPLGISSEETICASCSSVYLTVNNTPVLVGDASFFLSEVFFSIKNHIKNVNNYLQYNIDLSKFQTERESVINSIIDSYKVNLQIYDKMLDPIRGYVQSDHFQYITLSNDPVVGKELLYLKRDWSYLPESEKELHIIITAVKNLIDKHSDHLENVFFIGSGTGRFAYEFSKLLSANIYCSDLSYRMMYFFNEILNKRAIQLMEINESNIYDINDSCIPHIIEKKDVLSGGNIIPFISDVKSLPLRSESMSLLLSIYFIDVMNVESYIQELYRVLEPGGLFINLGPVGYPYDNFVHKLLPAEIKKVFINFDFEIIDEEFVETPYMSSDKHLSTIIHKNWAFVARKKVNNKSVSVDAVLNISQPLFVNKEFKITNGGEIDYSSVFFTKQGVQYENADFMIELLSRIDGVKSLQLILDEIHAEFEIEYNLQDLLSNINNLIDAKVLKIS